MTLHVNETVRNLADSVRRRLEDAVAHSRAKGKHVRPVWDSLWSDVVRRAEELRVKANNIDSPTQKTAALGAGASLLLSGMVFGVAEAAVVTAPEGAVERQLVSTVPAEEPSSGEGGSNGEQGEGVGSTAPVEGEAPQKQPVPVDELIVTSPFGWRINPMTGYGQEWHTGTDFSGVTGTPVKSARGGTVTEAGWHTAGGGGLRIVVDHGDGVQTTYNHLNDIWVEPGQWVDEAQVIGGIGSTGNSTGPHLHFEVMIHGEFVDPMAWL